MSLVFYNFPGCVVAAEQIDEDWESQNLKVLCLNLTTQFAEDGPFGHVGATLVEAVFVFFVVRIPPFGSRCFKMPVRYNDVMVFHSLLQMRSKENLVVPLQAKEWKKYWNYPFWKLLNFFLVQQYRYIKV